MEDEKSESSEEIILKVKYFAKKSVSYYPKCNEAY